MMCWIDSNWTLFILQLCELRADSHPNDEGPYLMSGCGAAAKHNLTLDLLHFVRPHLKKKLRSAALKTLCTYSHSCRRTLALVSHKGWFSSAQRLWASNPAADC